MSAPKNPDPLFSVYPNRHVAGLAAAEFVQREVRQSVEREGRCRMIFGLPIS